MTFLDGPPRFLFFTGKGGVGKTSLACAAAVYLADSGRRVLLVSTDPASNVGQVFGLTIGNQIVEIDEVPSLSALEIDPQAAAQAYRDRLVGPVRGVLPDDVVKGIEEQLSGACTTEIAAFDEFTSLLTDGALRQTYDHIVFDTAPTGHTIRLLQLPGAWSNFLEAGRGDASCLGPLAGLQKQRTQYKAAVEALADPNQTRLILVTRPQKAALAEVARTQRELAAIGIGSQHIVINGMLPAAEARNDALAAAIVVREQAALGSLAAELRGLPRDVVPLLPFNLVGVPSLRAMLSGKPRIAESDKAPLPELHLPTLEALVDQMEADGRGLIMVVGKGGVGKTTLAASVAVELARRGHAVHLTTTDPAAHLTRTLQGAVENLKVSRIDPVEETARYREQVLATKGKDLDTQGLALLEEDLRSPCTEEIAVFRAFAAVVREGGRSFVVMDTAPTGHTLLLLDATGAYHRDMVRQLGPTGRHFTTPMMVLQDPKQTKVLIVTLAETTPVLEAEQLQADLRRAGIEPWSWVINASVAMARPSSTLLRQRARSEAAQIEAVRTRLAARLAILPLLPEEPIGPERLAQLLRADTALADAS